MTLTSYHAKYFANDLTRRATGGIDRLSLTASQCRPSMLQLLPEVAVSCCSGHVAKWSSANAASSRKAE
jgi:hypothetical protein